MLTWATQAQPPRSEQHGIVSALATYLFDLHSDSLSSWDDEGQECAKPEEIVQRASEMLTTALEGTRYDHAVVSVRDANGRWVLTVTLNRRLGPRSDWATPFASTRTSVEPDAITKSISCWLPVTTAGLFSCGATALSSPC